MLFSSYFFVEKSMQKLLTARTRAAYWLCSNSLQPIRNSILTLRGLLRLVNEDCILYILNTFVFGRFAEGDEVKLFA